MKLLWHFFEPFLSLMFSNLPRNVNCMRSPAVTQNFSLPKPLKHCFKMFIKSYDIVMKYYILLEWPLKTLVLQHNIMLTKVYHLELQKNKS